MKELDTPPAMLRESEARLDTLATAPLPSASAESAGIGHVILPLVLALILCLTVLAVFIPLNPLMPASGLDLSWMMAMNQAVAQHLEFGRDVIFTFGPYASIYTELYHPATDRRMIWGSLFLGLAYFSLLLFLGKGQKSYWLLLFGFLLAGVVNSRDTLLFSYPLVMALVVYRMTLPDGDAMKLVLAKPLEQAFPLLFAPLGLLPLIKGSLLPICSVTAVLCCGLIWHSGKKVLAGTAIGMTAISCALLWVAADQPLLALPSFFLSTKEIISGYSEAMALAGDPRECILYILGSALILLIAAWTPHIPRISRWFLGASYILFLFTAFKGSFVRHDPWHDITAGSSIFAAAFLLMFVVGVRRSRLPLLTAALVWAFIGHQTFQTGLNNLSWNFRGTFERAYQGTRKRWTGGELKKEYDRHIAAINAEFPIARMPGTSDIYSLDQTWLLASENVRSPRPVDQGYSAYTPELAQLNLMHLESAGAPDNVIFRIEPFDHRFPSLEDGLSWPALINRYSLMKLEPQALYLRKRATERQPIPVIESDIYSARHEFGEEVPLPEAEVPLLARLEITPTLAGKFLEAFFKPPKLFISVRLRDGRLMRYRALSNMMRTDFLITPLVTSTEEFALLSAGGNQYLGGNQVKSITMSSNDRRGLFWNSVYTLRLRKSDLAKNTAIENSLLFDKLNDGPPESHSPPLTLKCEGSIESINESLPSSDVSIVRGTLTLKGWMGVAAKEGIAPDSVFVLLTSETGGKLYVQAHSTPRDDVKKHFQQPGMPDPGFAAMIDVSGLNGSYTLGLARTYKGNLSVCQQFKLPLMINP
jgi:hypothetical protein